MRWPNLGFRREVVVVFVVTTMLLVLLLAYSVLAFHAALGRLVEERRMEAAGLAGRVVDQVTDVLPTAIDLRRTAPGALAVALIDGDGRILVSEGPFPAMPPAVLPQARAITGPVGFGPDEFFPERAAGFAPLKWHGQVILARVDLPATALAQRIRGLRVLTLVAGSAGLAIPILVLFFLRRLLDPYERMLEKARLVGEVQDSEDEMSFLLSTVERALGSLSHPGKDTSEDDILVLERTLGPSLQSGLLIMDEEGRVLALNDIASELLDVRLTKQRVPFNQLLAAHSEVREALARVVEDQTRVRRRELGIESPSGPLTLGLTVHVLRRDDGSVRGYFALFIDLTEIQRRNDEEKLARSLAQLGELTAGMAHELRNSLGTLRGYLTLIDRRATAGEANDADPAAGSLEDYLSEIRRETDHLQRVLEDFLSFARPGTRRIETVDIPRLLRQVSNDPSLGGKEIRIRGDLDVEHSLIKGDVQLLERALRNLLHNACRAEQDTGHEGALDVVVRRDLTEVEISILDRGPGVAEEMRGRLFEPFATSRPDGVGLGLALAHRIVALHGGRLSLESREEGGAVASLSLPAHPTGRSSGTGRVDPPRGPDDTSG